MHPVGGMRHSPTSLFIVFLELQNELGTDSVWSVPKFDTNHEMIEEFFGECYQCKNQVVHICKSDTILEAIYDFREAILKYEPKNGHI